MKNMRIDFGPDITSDTHYFNTGVRFTDCFIELSETGDSIVGNTAHRAYHAMSAYFGFKAQPLEVRKKFYEDWKRNNPR